METKFQFKDCSLEPFNCHFAQITPFSNILKVYGMFYLNFKSEIVNVL